MVVRGLRWREFLTYGRTRSISGKTRARFEFQESAEGGAVEILSGCKEDMKRLWQDGDVRGILKRRKTEMENNAGFFLNDIDRIATLSYLPSDNDVVRSRLRTVGGQEYRIFVDTTNTISGFDEVLLEDPSVNRLNDSVGLWKAIISSRLLQHTTMVCFLNKCDFLKRKLRSGIQFRNFVRDYGSQPNDITPMAKCACYLRLNKHRLQ
ncbi:hypothetical protein HHX47_DHR1000885 [Lentinula edodes]|nr:hypothetical protein HHX47_DHR1000885 [Lentinula edodes]